MTQQWQVQSPPPVKNGSVKNFPDFSDFMDFMDANEGIWAIYHTYSVKQSGYQKASDCNKKYGADYEFTSRYDSDLKIVTVYGRKKALF